MKIFFRADDLGWEQAQFERLAGLFVENGLKLNGAAVPLICREARAKLRLGRFEGHLEVHSHGLAHLDHEAAGKKAEFGESRREEDVARDLDLSHGAAKEAFGSFFYPAFVPPWNRLAERFLSLLPRAGFTLLSRDGKARAATAGLKELNISVDLHTSKKPGPETPEALLAEVERLSATTPAVGIMLHHSHMADRDFGFLGQFLRLVKERGFGSFFLSELAAI